MVRLTCPNHLAVFFADFDFSCKKDTLNRLLPKYRQLNEQIIPTLLNNIKQGVKMLIVMRGLPGSGKSTRIQNLIKEMRNVLQNPTFNPKIFSADDFFMTSKGYIFDKTKLGQAHNRCYKLAQQCLLNHESPVFIDNTNVRQEDLKRYYDLSYYNWYKFYVLEPETEWAFNVEKLYEKNTHNVRMIGLINMVKNYFIPQGMEFINTYEDDSSFYYTGANNSLNLSSPKEMQSENLHQPSQRYNRSKPSRYRIEQRDKQFCNKRQKLSKDNRAYYWEYAKYRSDSPKEQRSHKRLNEEEKYLRHKSYDSESTQDSKDDSVMKEDKPTQLDIPGTVTSSNQMELQNESMDNEINKYTLVSDEKVKERLKKQLSFFFRRKEEPKSSSTKSGLGHDELVHKYFNRSSSESSDETSEDERNLKETKRTNVQQETTVRHEGDNTKAFDSAEKKRRNIQMNLSDIKSIDFVNASNILLQTTNDTMLTSVTDTTTKPVSNLHEYIHRSKSIKDIIAEDELVSSNETNVSIQYQKPKEISDSKEYNKEENLGSRADTSQHDTEQLSEKTITEPLNDKTIRSDEDDQKSNTEDGEVLSDAEDTVKENAENDNTVEKTEEPAEQVAESEEEMEEGEIVDDDDSDGSIQEIADDDDIEMVYAAEKKPDPKRDVEKNRLRKQLMAIEEKIKAARRAKKKRRRSSSSSSSGSSASSRSRSSSSSSSRSSSSS